MGYELHITRRENWFDENDELAIPVEEWEQYVRNDPEFRLDNYAEAILHDGTVLRTEAPGIAVWEKYSGNGIDGNYAWFYYSLGNIACKNPDKEIIAKMIGVAQIMNAKVQGDEGKIYKTEKGKIISETENSRPSVSSKRSWWKFW